MGRHPRGRVLHVLRFFMMDERVRGVQTDGAEAVRRPSSELPRSSRVESSSLRVLYKYAIAALQTSVRNGLAHAPKAGKKSTLAPEVI